MLLSEQLSVLKKKILALNKSMPMLLITSLVAFNLMVEKDSAQEVATMANVVTKVTAINVFNNDAKARVTLSVDKAFKQFVQERDEKGNALGFDTMTEQDVLFVKMPLGKLVAQMCEVNDDIALHVAMLSHAVTKKDLVLLLLGSEIVVSHEFHAAGEVVGEDTEDQYTFEHDTYVTDIKEVKLCDRAKKYMEEFMFRA